jgi:hypothetical protein
VHSDSHVRKLVEQGIKAAKEKEREDARIYALSKNESAGPHQNYLPHLQPPPPMMYPYMQVAQPAAPQYAIDQYGNLQPISAAQLQQFIMRQSFNPSDVRDARQSFEGSKHSSAAKSSTKKEVKNRTNPQASATSQLHSGNLSQESKLGLNKSSALDNDHQDMD